MDTTPILEVLKSRQTKEGERRSNAKYKAKASTKKKLKAHAKVRTAVANGKLKKPSACSRCKRSGVRISFHHNKGYSGGSVTKGRWLCEACHTRLDSSRSGKGMSGSVKASWKAGGARRKASK